MENKKINLKKISDMTYEVLNSPFYVDGKGGNLEIEEQQLRLILLK